MKLLQRQTQQFIKRLGSFRYWPACFLLLCACSVDLNEKHWRLAEQYASEGQFLRAVEEYSRVVNLGQKSPLAIRSQIKIAQIYDEKLQDYPRAIRAWRDVMRRSEDESVKIQARMSVAKIYQVRMEDALSASSEYELIYKEYLQDKPGGASVLLAWARALFESSKYVDAAQHFGEFRKAYPGDSDAPRALLEEGRSWMAAGKLNEAKQAYQDLISKLSGHREYNSLVAEAYFGLGETFEGLNDMKSALEALKQSLSSYPNRQVVEVKIQKISQKMKDSPHYGIQKVKRAS